MATGDKTTAKHQIRHILEVCYPDCFVTGDKRGNIDSIKIVFEDSSQCLKSFGASRGTNPQAPGEQVLTHFDHFVSAFKQSAESKFQLQPQLKIYCIMLDDYVNMPISKGYEQAKRRAVRIAADQQFDTEDADGNTHTVEKIVPADGISFRDRRPYLELGKEIPADISDALHDRDDTLRHIMELLCRELLNPLERPNELLSSRQEEPKKPWEAQDQLPKMTTTSFELPPGARVLVNGHNLKLSDLHDIAAIFPNRQMALDGWSITRGTEPYEPLCDTALWDANGFKSDADVYMTPVIVENVDMNNGMSARIAYLCRELSNAHGEADFGFFGMHHMLSRMLYREQNPNSAITEFPLVPFEILSVDTDIGMLAGFYLDRWQRLGRYDAMNMSCPVWVRTSPGLGWVFRRSFLVPAYEKWINVSLLYKLIQAVGLFPYVAPKQVSENGEAAATGVTRGQGVFTTNTNNSAEAPPPAPAYGSSDHEPSNYILKLKTNPLAGEPAQFRQWSVQFKTSVTHRWATLMCAMIAGGADYTSGHQGINYEKLFRAVRNYSNVIGDLVELNAPTDAEDMTEEKQQELADKASAAMTDPAVTVSDAMILQRAITKWKSHDMLGPLSQFLYVKGESYVRLICCAFILARNLEGIAPEKSPNTLFQDVWNATQRFAEKNRMSSAQEIDLRRKHLAHYLFMVSQIGNCRFTKELQNFEDYGFQRIDASQPWSTTNIMRVIQPRPSALVPKSPSASRKKASQVLVEDDEENQDVPKTPAKRKSSALTEAPGAPRMKKTKPAAAVLSSARRLLLDDDDD